MKFMRLEKGKSGVPLGLGSKLEASKETLPAIEVKNHVLWINSDLDLPFKLEVGKPADIGLFLSGQMENGTKSKHLEVEPFHKRSALLGRVVFGDRKQKEYKQQLYRDIDIKGLGYVMFSSSEPVRLYTGEVHKFGDNVESMGIFNHDDAYHDLEFTQAFHQYGIRTNSVIAIIALEEIVFNGKRISIVEAKEKSIIEATAEPVLEIRAFGTHARLVDVFTQENSQEKKSFN